MTAESKRLKVTCLISLFFGIVGIFCSLMLPIEIGVSVFAQLSALAASILSIVLGIHGARAANLPSKAKGLRSFALIISILACGTFVFAIYKGHGLTYFAALCLVAAVLDLLVTIFAHVVKRALDRA